MDRITGFFEVCIKGEDNISHLPLSLTVGVHTPWVFADIGFSAYTIAGITHHQQLTQADVLAVTTLQTL